MCEAYTSKGKKCKNAYSYGISVDGIIFCRAHCGISVQQGKWIKPFNPIPGWKDVWLKSLKDLDAYSTAKNMRKDYFEINNNQYIEEESNVSEDESEEEQNSFIADEDSIDQDDEEEKSFEYYTKEKYYVNKS